MLALSRRDHSHTLSLALLEGRRIMADNAKRNTVEVWDESYPTTSTVKGSIVASSKGQGVSFSQIRPKESNGDETKTVKLAICLDGRGKVFVRTHGANTALFLQFYKLHGIKADLRLAELVALNLGSILVNRRVGELLIDDKAPQDRLSDVPSVLLPTTGKVKRTTARFNALLAHYEATGIEVTDEMREAAELFASGAAKSEPEVPEPAPSGRKTH